MLPTNGIDSQTNNRKSKPLASLQHIQWRDRVAEMTWQTTGRSCLQQKIGASRQSLYLSRNWPLPDDIEGSSPSSALSTSSTSRPTANSNNDYCLSTLTHSLTHTRYTVALILWLSWCFVLNNMMISFSYYFIQERNKSVQKENEIEGRWGIRVLYRNSQLAANRCNAGADGRGRTRHVKDGKIVIKIKRRKREGEREREIGRI